MDRLNALPLENYQLPQPLRNKLLSPSLVIFRDQVRSNIQRMLTYVGNDPARWRPHLKTAKIPQIFEDYIRAGIRHFKCATPREAKVLFETLANLDVAEADLLVAYPHRGPALEQLAQLALDFPQYTTSVVCEDAAVAAAFPLALGIFIDINPGMNRTGIPLDRWNEVTQLADAVGDRLRGLHFYDGHIHAETKAERKRQTHALYDQLLDAKRRLEERGHSIAELVTSGTPTFLSALAYPGFQALSNCQHRVSPGTVVFHDMQYDSLLEDLELAPAAMVFTRIISHPADDIVTCDAGSKSLACEAGQPVAVALGHPTLEALGPSEEHLPMRVHGGTTPARGTELLLVPRHVCPTVNLAERAVLVEADGTYQVCEVAARAHDLMFPME